MLTLQLASLAVSCDLLHPCDLPKRVHQSELRVFHGKDVWAPVALMDVAAGRHHEELVLICLKSIKELIFTAWPNALLSRGKHYPSID